VLEAARGSLQQRVTRRKVLLMASACPMPVAPVHVDVDWLLAHRATSTKQKFAADRGDARFVGLIQRKQ